MVVRCTDPVVCVIDEDIPLHGCYDMLVLALEERGLRIVLRIYASHQAFLRDPADRADACILSARAGGKTASEIAASFSGLGRVFVYANGPAELVKRGSGLIAGVFSKGLDGPLLAEALAKAFGELHQAARAA